MSLYSCTSSPCYKEFSPKVFMGRTNTFRVLPKALWIGDVESKNQIDCHLFPLSQLDKHHHSRVWRAGRGVLWSAGQHISRRERKNGRERLARKAAAYRP